MPYKEKEKTTRRNRKKKNDGRIMTAGNLIPINGHSPIISFPETALRVNLSSIIVVQSRVFELKFYQVAGMQ